MGTDSDAVLYEQQDHTVTLTLNRPEKRNPISERDVVDALTAALARVGADPSVRAVILTGAGTAFSSGGDIAVMEAALSERARDPSATALYYRDGIQRIPLAFEALDVPVIAAVNGPAIGAGLDLACMCDLRIASDKARFAESFVKLGIIPGDGGAWLLPRTIGYARAAELSFTGDVIDAGEALSLGLVSRVVPAEELMSTAQALAARIAANPPQAVRMTKRLLVRGRDVRLDALLELSATMQSLAHTTTDHREAVRAFIEKRPPVFTGR